MANTLVWSVEYIRVLARLRSFVAVLRNADNGACPGRHKRDFFNEFGSLTRDMTVSYRKSAPCPYRFARVEMEDYYMRAWSLSGLLLALPLLSAAAVTDPIGDTYGTGMPFDISFVSGITNGTSTTFEIKFSSPLPASLDANLWGAIEIDVDRNAATGKSSELDYPNMNFSHGVDYVIGFYYDDDLGTAAILDVTNNNFFSLPAEYGSDYFRITVPVVGLGGDTRMHYAVGVGDGLDINSAYSDIAGNNYELLLTETPEPATWSVCGAALGLVGWARMRRRAKIDCSLKH